jgi:DUF4097 and DUF4098 domain-containing protein YvlB
MPEARRLAIATRSGSVRVVAEPHAGFTVRGGALVEAADGSLRVDADDHGSGEIVVRCPSGTSVVVGTMSGRVELAGDLGDASVTTRSGRISVESARNADLRTASGRVEVGACTETCRVVAASGRIHVERAGAVDLVTKSGRITASRVQRATVKSASGRIEVGTDRSPVVVVRSHSGSVDISVPADARPAARLASRSGRISNECSEGDDGEIDVETTSGRIAVTCR